MAFDATTLLTATEVGTLLGVTRQHIGQLTAQGVLVREDGKYQLGQTLAAYVAHLKSDARRASRSKAENRVRDARAAEIELRVQRQQHRVVDTEETLHFIDAMFGKFVVALSGVPARVGRNDLELRHRVEVELDAARNVAADEFGRQAAHLREHGEAAPIKWSV
jgi:hypothetical protein